MEARKLLVDSPAQTAALGERLGEVLTDGDLVGLVGDLGAGKTWLVQAVARGLGLPPDAAVVSPTFTLINEYDGGRLPLRHADIYRIEGEAELEHLGLDEMCRRDDGVLLVEWADRFDVLPADHLLISMQVTGDESREIAVSVGGPRSEALLARWLAPR